MDWWLDILPVDEKAFRDESEIQISYHNKHRSIKADRRSHQNRNEDEVMLVRNRTSRIFYGGKFYDYPISLSMQTISNLGLIRMAKIGVSYIRARLFPIKQEDNLEQFFINRFGRELYATFFRDYTEKVWGVPCTEITSEWGAQRIKGLSITKAVTHAFKQMFTSTRSINQKQTETSLIEYFLYPKLGPGQMWDCVAKDVIALGGEIHYQYRVDEIDMDKNGVSSISCVNPETHDRYSIPADYCFSTMPIRQLVKAFNPPAPGHVRTVSDGLVYRDFITVGLLVNKLKVQPKTNSGTKLIPDNWIYIQEPQVKLGRLQIFNNWSPTMVADPGKVWIGLEYFCNEGDEFWNMQDADIREVHEINIVEQSEVIDSVIIKMPKAYPAYFGTFDQLPVIREHVDKIQNLFLVGRNGMHKYNNQDHSMLSAITAVENIINGVTDKQNIWDINTEEEYHESK
jgi:protoporphyrinogen oxidase